MEDDIRIATEKAEIVFRRILEFDLDGIKKLVNSVLSDRRKNNTGVIYEVDPQVKRTGICHTDSGGLVSLGWGDNRNNPGLL
jgi:hypothetical protein